MKNNMKARVCNLYKTEADWNKLNFAPLDGELVVYAPDKSYDYARLKVGYCNIPIQSLPFFVTEDYIDAKLAEYQYATIVDAGRISDYLPKK